MTEDPDPFRGPWMNSKTAAAYLCKSLGAYYIWRKRRGIIPNNDGLVTKADLDRELRRKKPPRVVSAASRANLRQEKEATV